jgi:nucleoside-diphosphate-sugar epimerase
MPTLLCFGLGYSCEHYLARFGGRFDRIIGTVRTPEKAAALASTLGTQQPVEVLTFDGTSAAPELFERIAQADAILTSVPPGPDSDPVLAHFSDALARSPRLRLIVYLSTIGVYGDSSSGWVDETSEARPGSPRSKARFAAECAWQELGETGRAVAVLRLAGIYGPGRNALVNVANGTAKRIVKPGQVFNRIHVHDIAQAINACFAHGGSGIFNLADDEPSPPQDVIVFAAALLGVPPPPEIPFADAQPAMSAMAQSFYAENRRVRNDKLKRELGVRLMYPTYHEGLRALFAAGERPQVELFKTPR